MGVTAIVALTIAACAVLSVTLQLMSFNYTYDPIHSASQSPRHANRKIGVNRTDPVTMGESEDRVFVLLQVSDLHLSVNFDSRRGPDFKIFCTQVIDTIRPSVTLVTGDLTDARTKRLMAGEQYEKEWQEYYSIVNDTNASQKTVWLDIRGNHDDFGVFGPEAENNYYKQYSVQGRHHRSHFSRLVVNGSETYAFIAVDACLTPGPNRPFNTMGLLRSTDIAVLQDLKEQLPVHNMSIWFGHYPTRAITGPGHPDGLCDLIDGPYLSGHIHAVDLYMTQGQGFLDAELADWRAKRKFRVAAVDTGIFSFTDVVLHDWPVILITNPKAAAFQMPRFEPLHRSLASTHIRALIFSPSPIVSATVRIGDSDTWTPMRRVSGKSDLFVAEWEPEKYSSGLHRITVRAMDSGGNEGNSSHVFSFDGSRPTVNLKSKLIMGFPHQTSWACFFFLAVALNIVPLLLLRLLDKFPVSRKLRVKSQKRLPFYWSPFAKVYLLTCVDRIFLPVICIPLYLTFGPWLIGEVVPGHYAVCFVFGLWTDSGSFLPGGVSYVLAALTVILIHGPFTLTLAHFVHLKYRLLTRDVDGSSSQTNGKLCNKYFDCGKLAACLILSLHAFLCIVYADGYGIVALVTGFACSWTLILNLFLWKSISRLTLTDFRPMVRRRTDDRRSPPVNVTSGTGAQMAPDDEDENAGRQQEWETTDLLKERTD